MRRPAAEQVERVAVIGAGVIGGGWVAHFLRNGLAVTVWDPAAEAEAKLRQRLADVWPVLTRLGLHQNASLNNLTFAPTLAAAVAEAQFVQENSPERLPIKIETLGAIDAAAPTETVIASSTSGYMMSEMVEQVRHPERCVVAHPFNPPYLMPLVEVVAGEKTAPATVEWAMAFYRATGKKPLHCSQEIPGFVADRLMEAIWRESLHMVDKGMATVAEIDAAIRYGPGLRWALMGPLTVLHLGGGEGGMRHLLQQFGPSLKAPWTFLEAPELTAELSHQLIEGCAHLTAGFSIKELEQERDDLLVQLLAMLEQSKLWHLGEPALRQAQGQAGEQRQLGEPVEPLQLYASTVDAAWIDYNGHMTESSYLWVFGEASDALFRHVGIDDDYRATGHSFYTVETHINYYREVGVGEPLRVTTQLLGMDAKRLHLFHAMYHGTSGTLLATTEQMLLHVDMRASAASPILPAVADALRAILADHQMLPLPVQVGRQIAIKKK